MKFEQVAVQAVFLAGLYAVFLLVVFIHELGHALGGLACGFRIVTMRVGPVEFRNPGGLNTKLQWNGFLTGAVSVQARTEQITRPAWRYCAFIAAGPLANLVFALLLVPLSLRNTDFAGGCKILIFCSSLLAFLNLLPLHHRHKATDGRKLWDAVVDKSQREAIPMRLTLAVRVKEFKDLYASGRFEESLERLDDLVRTFRSLPELASRREAIAELIELKATITRVLVDQANQSKGLVISGANPDSNPSLA